MIPDRSNWIQRSVWHIYVYHEHRPSRSSWHSTSFLFGIFQDTNLSSVANYPGSRFFVFFCSNSGLMLVHYQYTPRPCSSTFFPVCHPQIFFIWLYNFKVWSWGNVVKRIGSSGCIRYNYLHSEAKRCPRTLCSILGALNTRPTNVLYAAYCKNVPGTYLNTTPYRQKKGLEVLLHTFSSRH